MLDGIGWVWGVGGQFSERHLCWGMGAGVVGRVA